MSIRGKLGLLDVSSKGIPCQGVMLLNSGCVTTDVDLNAAFEAMELFKANTAS